MYEFKTDDVYDFARHVGIQHKARGDELQFITCPYCKGGANRKDKGTFSINLKTGQFKCLRASCNVLGNMLTLAQDFDFSLGQTVDEYYQPKKQYRKLPKPKEPIKPKPEAIQYLEKRGISQEIAERYEITVQTNNPNILVFPFYDEKGILQFVKYRKTDFDKEKDKNKEWCEANCKPILFGMKQCKDFSRLIITEGQCFNGDAEIMTPTGWLRLENYDGSEVLQVNADMTANFVKPKSYIVKRHCGKMIDVEIGGNYFTSTTDDHNLVFITNKGEVIKKMAGEKISSAYHIPTAINFNNNMCNWSNDEIALFLAISADGTLDFRKNTWRNKGETNIYARFGLTKERKVNRLRKILNNLGYLFSDNILTGSSGNKYHSICFNVPDKFNTKYLPWWFVTETSLEQKKFIIEEMVWWDGNHVNNRNQYEYTTLYKHNADVIQAVASTCGYMSTIMKKQSGGNGEFKKNYTYKVSVLLKKNNVSTQTFEEHKVIYDVDKQVYCVSVDSGMILVRQKNKISVSGNCDSLSIATAGINNAVSVPTGANGFTWVPYCWDWINKFQEIVIFGDYEKGHITLLDEMKKRLKTTVKHVREEDYKDCKDANEILLKYGKEQVRKCVENAINIPVRHLIRMADIKGRNKYEIPKISTGIKKFDIILRGGLPFGGLTIVTGKSGKGKSTLANQIIINALEQKNKCMVYSGELPNDDLRSYMDYQVAGPSHIYEYSNPYCEKSFAVSKTNKSLISNWYGDNFWVYDDSDIDDDVEEEDGIIYLIKESMMKYNVKVFLIDNLMTAIDLEKIKETGNDKQAIFVKRLARIAKRYKLVIILIAHKRKNNFSSEANDEVLGSSIITNLASVIISYDEDEELPPEQRIGSITKNRLFGKKGYCTLTWDEKSTRIYGDGDDLYREYSWISQLQDNSGFVKVEINEDNPFAV